MRATLWGTDHEELDRIASATAGEHAAIALTRGRFPKTYNYLDPNEDAVAAIAGERATLLVCADGHDGVTASHVAVGAVLEALGGDPPPGLDDDEWIDLFLAANDAVLAAKERDGIHPASDTVLLVALATRERLEFGAIGDAALVVCRPGAERGRQLNREAMRFLGSRMSRRAAKGTVQRGCAALHPGEWVVMATDGLSEFVVPQRPADVLPRVLALAPEQTAEAGAVAIVEAACSAGAGDNVGAVVLAP